MSDVEFDWLEPDDPRLPDSIRIANRNRDVRVAYAEEDGRWAALPVAVECLEDALFDPDKMAREELAKVLDEGAVF